MKIPFLFSLLSLIYWQASAQQVLNSAKLPAGYVDGVSGTEIINTPPGQSVHFVPNGSFEHIGQFYVDANGVYDASFVATEPYVNNENGPTDYFGYAPHGSGTFGGPYLGSGIMGASPNNGGSGAGSPSFDKLVLTSTGPFPLQASIQLYTELKFNASPGSGSSIINVPDGISVVISGATTFTGANDMNYIDGAVGYALPFSFVGLERVYPIGDSKNVQHPYHPLYVTYAATFERSMAGRYINANPLPVSTSYLGDGIGAVSTVGSWTITNAGPNTSFTVLIPQPEGLGDNPDPSKLRLVVWTGAKWELLDLLADTGAKAPIGGAGSDLNGYTLSGIIPRRTQLANISALGIGLVSQAALPVSLIAFSGVWTDNVGAQLSWQTSLETNNDHFEIQRSDNAKSFEAIGRVQGKGTTQARSDYTFTDADMPGQVSYYRLKQVDWDGSAHLSTIISVNRRDSKPQPGSLSLGPVPTSGSLSLQLPAGKTISELSVYSLPGRRLYSQTGPQPTTDVSALPAGVYLLQVLTTDGQRLNTRFVKQ